MKNFLFLLFFTLYYIQSFTQNNSVSYQGGKVYTSFLDESHETIDGSSSIISSYGSTIKYNANTDTYTIDIYFNLENKYLKQIYMYDYTDNEGTKIYRNLNNNNSTTSYNVIYDKLKKEGNLLIMLNNLIKREGRFVYYTMIFKEFKTN